MSEHAPRPQADCWSLCSNTETLLFLLDAARFQACCIHLPNTLTLLFPLIPLPDPTS